MSALQCEQKKRSGPARLHRRPDAGRVRPRVAQAYVSARLPLLDDFRPHVWRTEDYGETWTRIVDGIRDDAYVNSVREDPNREGLLYAGTNHGVYVTYDDGGWWQELNPGLPDIPVTDVIPEHDELAMASHGRGFWVLDNVGPLRQVEAGSGGAPGTTERDLVLFEPAPAYRSANGVVISWWVGEGVGSASDASLDVLDATGEVVRTFEPAREGEERDRWSGPALPVGTGLQRVRWDLRTDPAATFPGMILWGVRTMAPAVPPGEYRVRLRVGRSVMSERLVVKRNPWIEGVTDEDLVAQYEFGVRVRDQVDRANRAVIEIRRVKGELEEKLGASDDERLREAGDRLRAALDEIEGEIYQVRNRSNQDPLNFPIKVNNRLANLLSMSERGDGRPGSGMEEVFGVMVGRLEGLLAELAAVWEGELAEVNAGLERLGKRGIAPGEVTVGDGEEEGEEREVVEVNGAVEGMNVHDEVVRKRRDTGNLARSRLMSSEAKADVRTRMLLCPRLEQRVTPVIRSICHSSVHVNRHLAYQ